MSETGKCSICGGPYIRYGHNAEPFNHGRCCSDCNASVVIPIRIMLIARGRDPRQVNGNPILAKGKEV